MGGAVDKNHDFSFDLQRSRDLLVALSVSPRTVEPLTIYAKSVEALRVVPIFIEHYFSLIDLSKSRSLR
jgi:hypothetical protein